MSVWPTMKTLWLGLAASHLAISTKVGADSGLSTDLPLSKYRP